MSVENCDNEKTCLYCWTKEIGIIEYSDPPDVGKLYEHVLSCGHEIEAPYSYPPEYCPYCGARVLPS